MSVVIVHPTDGIFIGEKLGLGVWSKLDPAGQDAAAAFKDVAEAEAVMRRWIGGRPDGVVFRQVEADRNNGLHASIEACVRAGLPAWDPNSKASDVEHQPTAQGLAAKASLLAEQNDPRAAFVDQIARAAAILETPERYVTLDDGKYRFAFDYNKDGSPLMATVFRKGEMWRLYAGDETPYVAVTELEKVDRLNKAMREIGASGFINKTISLCQAANDVNTAAQVEAVATKIADLLKPLAADVERTAAVRGDSLLYVGIPNTQLSLVQGAQGGLYVHHDDGRKANEVGNNVLLAAGHRLEAARDAAVEVGWGYLARVQGAVRPRETSPSQESAGRTDRQDMRQAQPDGSNPSSRSTTMTTEKTASEKAPRPKFADEVEAKTPAEARADMIGRIENAMLIFKKGPDGKSVPSLDDNGEQKRWPSFQLQASKAEIDFAAGRSKELPQGASQAVVDALKVFEGAVKQPEFAKGDNQRNTQTGVTHDGKKGLAHLADNFGEQMRAGGQTQRYRAVHLNPDAMKAIAEKIPEKKVKDALLALGTAREETVLRNIANRGAKAKAAEMNKSSAGMER
jgi:hypothetical protein